MKLKRLFLVVLACMTLGWVQAFAQINPNNRIVYVKEADSDTGDGSSWENATNDLSAALTAAALGSDIEEIWVAKGTYKPTAPGGRFATFSIPAGVKVYGGFEGTDGETVKGRSISENETILSGDIGTLVTNTDNVYHVVTIAGDGVVLDGFTIQDGYANGAASPANAGGGIYINAATGVTLSNLTVTGNTASANGGGICLTSATGVTLSSLTVTGNTASNGGGIYSTNSDFIMSTSTVCENSAQYGGGINVSGSNSDGVFLRNSLIYANKASDSNGNEMTLNANLNITFENTTVVTTESGKSMTFNTGITVTLRNSIVTTNRSTGNAIHTNGTYIYHSTNSYAQRIETPGSSNVPKLTSGEEYIEGTKNPESFFEDLANGEYRLAVCSPLVNTGDNYFAVGHTDLDGEERIFDTTVDIGCYEFQTPALPQHVLTLGGDEELLDQNIKRGQSITDVVFSYSGGATGAQVEGLPAGVEHSVSGGIITISGTPTADNAFGIYNYTVSTLSTPESTNECTPVVTTGGSIILSPDVDPTDGVLYVKKGGTGRGNSWDEALGELSEAVLAAADAPDVKQIWVGTGEPGVPATFTPAYAITEELDWEGNPATDRDNTFLLLDGIKIYGGFDPDNAVNAITNLDHKRDSSLTILSGILPGDVRVYHVVTALNHSATTNDETNHIVIDGFTITGGQADGVHRVTVGDFDVERSSGAGIYAQAGEGFITITASEIYGNTANNSGGGIYADAKDGSIFVTGNTIRDNKIEAGEDKIAYGGGIYAYGYVKITENDISGNEASGSFEASGGGIYARYNKFARSTGGGNVESSSIPFAPFAIGDEELEPIQAMDIGYNQITNNKALHDNFASGGGIALDGYYGGGGSVDAAPSLAPASIGVDEDNRALIVYNTLEGNTAGNEGGSGNIGGGISAGYREEEGGGGNEENSANSMLLRAATEVRFSGDVVIGYNLLKGNTVYGDGGGIYTGLNDASISIVNNVIVENTAENDGGGICLPNAGYNSTTLNNTIAGNTAGRNGGGMYHEVLSTDDERSAEIYNTILYENQADGAGNDLYIKDTEGSVRNSWFYNNLIGIIEGSGVNLIDEGDGNIIGNQGVAVFAGGETGNYNYSLAPNSPAINAGDNQYWSWYVSDDFVDFVGNNRIFGPAIDMGAYEDNNCPTSITTDLGDVESTVITVVPDTDGRVYVKDYENDNTANSNAGDGSSWETAHGSLADVLLYAQNYPTCVSEIWVAEGTYYPKYRLAEVDDNYGNPQPTTSRDKTFFIADGVHMYGGFDPAATNDYDDKDNIVYRNWNKWETVLDGDLGRDDSDSDATKDNNAYHVVAVPQLSALTEFNGFIITNGYTARNEGSSVFVGGGIYFNREHGAGMYINNVHEYEGAQTFYVKNTIIKNNDAYDAGGGVHIYSSSAPVFVNTLIHSNTAGAGGGVYIGDALRSATPALEPTFINVTIANNEARNRGGGICNEGKAFYLANSIVWGNTLEEGGEEATYSIYSSGTQEINYSIIEVREEFPSVWPGDGNSVKDPQFVGAEDDNDNYDYRLALGSPAIDKGNNEDYYTIVDKDNDGLLPDERDLAAVLRITDGTSSGTATIDMGAYEFQSCIPVMIWLGGSANWQDPANWYPDGIPASCTDVYIPGVSVEEKDDYHFPNLKGDQTDNVCDRIFFMPGAQLGRQSLLSYNEAHVEIDYSGEGSSFTPAKGEDIFDDYTEFVALGRDDNRAITSEHRVQFGAKYSGVTLDRDRWNMLSAPLKELTTGDFAFGGFPFSFIKKFDAEQGSTSSFIKGKWADFSNETDLGFTPGLGFGHYYYPYKDNTPYGMDNSADGFLQWENAKTIGVPANAPAPTHIDDKDDDKYEFGLAQSNGILHFPYFDDEYLSRARRSHQYEEIGTGTGAGTEGTSTFNFFYQSPLTSSYFLQWTGKTETVDRTGAAYRFITEGWDGKYTLSGTFEEEEDKNFALIGNPYMGALDFEQFFLQNRGTIKRSFLIRTIEGNYFTYQNTDIGDDPGTSPDRFIAPMQSFLVEIATDINEESITLNFDEAKMSTVNTDTKLRAAHSSLPTDRLTITARNANGETKTTVRRRDNAKDGFCNGDFSLIIDNPDKLPRVYTLVRTNSGKPRALFTNSIQSDEIAVPVGLVSTQAGNIEFTITGMDTYDAKVYFVDMVENTQTEITGESAFRYEFAYTPDASSVLENRFLISFAPGSSTGINPEGVEVKNLTAYASGEDLIVISTETALIQTVAVYDLQGRCLAREEAGQVSTFRMKSALQSAGVYLVKVQTPLGVKEIKVIK